MPEVRLIGATDVVPAAIVTLVNVPTDVMLGCAAVVTVPAVVAVPAAATFRLATCVVDVTMNGAVPVAMLDWNTVAFACAFTLRAVSVPNDVMLGWAAVVTVPAVVADTAVPEAATLRLATWVVLLTVNGAVPVAMLLMKVLALMLPNVPEMVPAVSVASE